VSHPPVLVWFAEVPFSGSPHRQQHLAKLLSDRYEVVFVEPPPPLRPPRIGIRKAGGVWLAQVAPVLNARPWWIRQALSVPRLRRAASMLAAVQVRRALDMVGNAANRPVVVCSNVFLVQAAIALRPRLLIADLCDDPRYYPGEPAWTPELLIRLLFSADVVSTSSLALEREFTKLGARRVVHVPNGVHEDFLRATASTRVASPGAVGFLGHIGPWVDMELLETLADALPEHTLQLVGSLAPAAKPALERLLRRPNTRFVPQVAYTAVPNVLRQFSVGLIPFRSSAYTRAVNPIKLYEYAAADLPIVSTAFSPDVARFDGVVDVCDTVDEFVDLVRARAEGRGLRSTRWIAEAHSWSRISDQFKVLVDAGLQAAAA